MKIEEFHYLVGQTIMYCQIIEHDVKLIYAGMLLGDFNENLNKIKKWTLGRTIRNLEELDFSDENNYLLNDDYNFLKQMTEKRNHWCHQTYLNFIYDNHFWGSKKYLDECRKLKDDNERLLKVYNVLEKLRMKALRDFNRI